MGYNTIDTGYPYRLRGTVQQSDEGLLLTCPSIRVNQVGGNASSTTMLTPGFTIAYAGLQNRSGSTIVVGVGGRLPNRLWIAGQYAASTFTDDTADAQSTATGDFPLETTTNNSGFVVASPVKFNAISINCSTASAGGSAVRAVKYSNYAGTGWSTMSNLFVQDAATGDWTQTTTNASEQLIVWAAPADWGKTAAAGLDGITGGLYAVLVQATTAPSGTAGVASNLAVCVLYLGTEGIADNTLWEYSPNKPELRFPECDGGVALFSTANAQNRLTLHTRAGC